MGAHRRTHRLAACAIVPALAFAIAACGGNGGSERASDGAETAAKVAQLSPTTPPATGDLDRVTWALGSEPASLDWVYGYDYPPNTVLANLCESLLRIGPDFSTQPNLAERVDNPDARTWVYQLRSGVKFHSGAEMTADDAVFSLRRHMDPDVGSYWSTAFANVRSIEKTGDLEMTVKLEQPDALFNQVMAVPPGVVERKASVERLGKDYGGPDKGVDCTGPFEFGHWDKGQSVTLERFDGYWDPERKAHAAQLEIDFISDTNARVNAILSGAVDGTYALPFSAVGKVERAGVGKVVRGPQTSTMNLIVADLEGPLADQKIRKALSLALDREGFISAALGGRAEPSRAVASRLTWGTGPAHDVYEKAWDALPESAQDLEAAKALVAEAGAPDEPVVIAVSSGDSVVQVLANEVQAAGKRIGVDVEIKLIPPDSYGALFGEAKARKGIDLFWTTWYADIADALQIYQNWESSSFANYGGWKDPAYDKLVANALAEPDPVKRAEIVVRAQAVVSEQLPWLPIAHAPLLAYMSKRITGAPASNAYLYYPWGAEVGAAG